MINILDKSITIGEVAAQLPEASKIFDEYGIDYCCGGNRRLYDVITAQAVSEEEITGRLNDAIDRRKEGYSGRSDFTGMEAGELSTYIEDIHHGYLRQALPETAEILAVTLRAHGANHPELYKVYKLFGTLKTDLEQHLLKEETMLFPALTDEDTPDEIRISLAKDIIGEHEAAGEILSELRRITKDYKIPADACPTFAKAYELLEGIEKDLHQHIHLENNILLKEYDER
jgi:regulator of cell morphogenesis and NO signaling